jgi:hypothetical protein
MFGKNLPSFSLNDCCRFLIPHSVSLLLSSTEPSLEKIMIKPHSVFFRVFRGSIKHPIECDLGYFVVGDGPGFEGDRNRKQTRWPQAMKNWMPTVTPSHLRQSASICGSHLQLAFPPPNFLFSVSSLVQKTIVFYGCHPIHLCSSVPLAEAMPWFAPETLID